MSSKRGGRGGRGPLPRNVQVSKKLSWLLRHGAASERLELGPGGYANVKDALNTQALRSLKITFEELREIVATNDKQRFSLIHVSAAPKEASSSIAEPSEVPNDDAATVLTESLARSSVQENEPACFLIRANQGHSINVDTEGLLEPITSDSSIPGIVVHGTTHQAWPLILRSGGLMRMGRTHVHFAAGLPSGFKPLDDESSAQAETEQSPVISGMRNTSSILIYIDISKALEAGLKFWRSENGVILSEGDDNGIIGMQFFGRVEERRVGLGVLMKDGEVTQELPANLTTSRGGRGGRIGRGGGRGRGGGKPRLHLESSAADIQL